MRKHLKILQQLSVSAKVSTIASLLVLLSIFVSPSTFWPAIFLNYSIPFVLGVNFIFLVFFLLRRKRSWILPLFILLVGSPFLSATYRVKVQQKPSEADLSILSFNVKLFRQPGVYEKFSLKSIKWIAEDTTAIKCFQEFSTNNQWKVLDVTRQIKEKNYFSFTYREQNLNSPHNRGLAIFSKYPMLDSGIVWRDNKTFNAAIYVDIKKGNDTIRIYNVHLASMNLDLTSQKNSLQKVGMSLRKLKEGSIERESQLQRLIDHTRTCRLPMIICGDFNETPYSYNYFRMKRDFSNAFENAGSGFGFSYNGTPHLLRIDHHFFSSDVESLAFSVDERMKLSDHFPTRGAYLLKNKKESQ